jgi:hypothetical protein
VKNTLAYYGKVLLRRPLVASLHQKCATTRQTGAAKFPRMQICHFIPEKIVNVLKGLKKSLIDSEILKSLHRLMEAKSLFSLQYMAQRHLGE